MRANPCDSAYMKRERPARSLNRNSPEVVATTLQLWAGITNRVGMMHETVPRRSFKRALRIAINRTLTGDDEFRAAVADAASRTARRLQEEAVQLAKVLPHGPRRRIQGQIVTGRTRGL